MKLKPSHSGKLSKHHQLDQPTLLAVVTKNWLDWTNKCVHIAPPTNIPPHNPVWPFSAAIGINVCNKLQLLVMSRHQLNRKVKCSLPASVSKQRGKCTVIHQLNRIHLHPVQFPLEKTSQRSRNVRYARISIVQFDHPYVPKNWNTKNADKPLLFRKKLKIKTESTHQWLAVVERLSKKLLVWINSFATKCTVYCPTK